MNNNNMCQFYEQWRMLVNRQPVAVEMQRIGDKSHIKTGRLLVVIRPPMAGEMDLQDFFA